VPNLGGPELLILLLLIGVPVIVVVLIVRALMNRGSRSNR